MRATVYKVERKNFWWIIVLILLVLPIILEYFLGEKLFNNTHDEIEKVQKFMYEKFDLKSYDNYEKELEQENETTNQINIDYVESFNYIYSFLDDNETDETNVTNDTIIEDTSKGSTKDIFMTEFIHVINSNAFYVMLTAFLYNFMNVFKIFLLYMTIFLSNLISSTLSYIFQSPKPYMAFYKLKSLAFFNEWGSPNNQVVLLITYGCCFYRTIIANKNLEKKLYAKIIIIILLVFYAFIDGFLLFASGNLTFNQLMISILLAVSIYLFVFHNFTINLNNDKQFYDFLKFNTYYWLVLNLLLLAFQILLANFITNRRDIKYYENNLSIQANRLPVNDFVKDYCKYRTTLALNNGNFCNVISFLMNIVAFLSVKADLKFNYANTYSSWKEGNFEVPRVGGINNDEQQGNVNEYNNIEQSQWNHNKCHIVFFRTLLSVVLMAIIFIFFIWVTHFTDDEIILFIFLIGMPLVLTIFGNLFLFKAAFIKMKLARKPRIKLKNLLY